MSWALAANWAIMAGSLCFTVGTGAQAVANLNEYRWHVQFKHGWAWFTFRRAYEYYILLTGRGVETKDETVVLGSSTGFAMVTVSTMLRMARVWSILTLGSVLVLAGAIIQLVLAYTA